MDSSIRLGPAFPQPGRMTPFLPLDEHSEYLQVVPGYDNVPRLLNNDIQGLI